MWWRRDVATASRCVDVKFSITGGNKEGYIEEVGMFTYF